MLTIVAVKLTFAFSQEINGFGIIAFQVGRGADGETQFDIFAIPDQDTSVGDMLTKFDSGSLLQEFEAARLFTDSLSGLFVSYAHVSFGPSVPYKTGSGFQMEQLTLAIELRERHRYS
jgi:hypothetical protein